jgi:uncharacterized membrane protein
MGKADGLREDARDALQQKGGAGARLRSYFFTGVVVTAPIVITLWSAWWVLTFLDALIARIIPPEYNPNTYLPFAIPGLGLIVTILFFILVGFFARNFLGRMIIRASEFIVGRMPLLNTVYKAIKQVFEMTMGAQSTAFREVVLFQYPNEHSWTIGFVTGVTPGDIQKAGNGDEVLNVYSPVTPTTAGFIFFIPRSKLIFLSMSVEDAVKLIASGGIITPPVKTV